MKPTILLGVTGVGRTFTEGLIREMARHVTTPIIFPLSNPTANAECTPEQARVCLPRGGGERGATPACPRVLCPQAYRWTDCRAVVATGSPYGHVDVAGRYLFPSQANNMHVFPGIGAR